jgi:hypothetical protein
MHAPVDDAEDEAQAEIGSAATALTVPPISAARLPRSRRVGQDKRQDRRHHRLSPRVIHKDGQRT